MATVRTALLCLIFGELLYLAVKIEERQKGISGLPGLPLWFPCLLAAGILFVIVETK